MVTHSQRVVSVERGQRLYSDGTSAFLLTNLPGESRAMGRTRQVQVVIPKAANYSLLFSKNPSTFRQSLWAALAGWLS